MEIEFTFTQMEIDWSQRSPTVSGKINGKTWATDFYKGRWLLYHQGDRLTTYERQHILGQLKSNTPGRLARTWLRAWRRKTKLYHYPGDA